MICLTIYNDYLIDFLRVLLQSFKDTYKIPPKIMLYYFEVSTKYIDEIKNNYPRAILKECSEFKEIAKERLIRQRVPKKVEIWYKMFLDSPEDKLIFMDIDMLVIKPFEHYLTDDFDWGYCYRTRKVLHGTINAGVFLVNRNQKTKQLFEELIAYSQKLLANFKKAEKTRTIWGGPDQAFFGYLLKGKYKKDFNYKGVALRGFPIELFNCFRVEKIPKKTCVLHYPGGWRFVLIDGITEKMTTARVKRYQTQYKKMRRLWEKALLRWKEKKG